MKIVNTDACEKFPLLKFGCKLHRRTRKVDWRSNYLVCSSITCYLQ